MESPKYTQETSVKRATARALAVAALCATGCLDGAPSVRVEPAGRVVILKDDGTIDEEANAELESLRREAQVEIDSHECIVPQSALDPIVRARESFMLRHEERLRPEKWYVDDRKCMNRRFVINTNVENCLNCGVLKTGELFLPKHRRQGRSY